MSREIESEIESYGEGKYNIYLPNCIKTSKNFSSVFGDFRFPKYLTSFFSPRYLVGTCVPTSYYRNKISNFISCHVKPRISSFTPTH
jgi:hypothetical protein